MRWLWLTRFLDSPEEITEANQLSRVLKLTIGGWVVVISLGLIYLWNYETTPGRVAEPPIAWPTSSTTMVRNSSGYTFVMFAHPRCPCTRASLSELERLISRVGYNVTGYVTFLQPESEDPNWCHTDLWSRVESLPGVQPVHDPAGKLAARFGAVVSGHVLLYDSNGRLSFSGGITHARGHEGDNPGRLAIEDIVSGDGDVPHDSPVYGCGLFSSSTSRVEETRSLVERAN